MNATYLDGLLTGITIGVKLSSQSLTTSSAKVIGNSPASDTNSKSPEAASTSIAALKNLLQLRMLASPTTSATTTPSDALISQESLPLRQQRPTLSATPTPRMQPAALDAVRDVLDRVRSQTTLAPSDAPVFNGSDLAREMNATGPGTMKSGPTRRRTATKKGI